ncbi:LmeA family phospholipid-binding protein [Mycobacterium sp. NPDC004974]
MTDPWARPTDQSPSAPSAELPPSPPAPDQPGQPAQPGQVEQPAPAAPQPQDPSALAKVRKLFSDPLSVVLVFVIVLALVAAGVLGGELFARSRADKIVASIVECIVQDGAKASFDPLPPFLLQHVSGHYTNINIETAGNQIRDAKGMQVKLGIEDVRIKETADASGTVGSLVADINWSTDGIRQTVADLVQLPFIGSAISDVKTNPSNGTIELKGLLGTITAKPTVVNKGISLQIVDLSAIGLSWPRETLQPILDKFTAQLTENYPMGIHADSVQVTDGGVVAKFSTTNASMPKAADDPCFDKL